MIVSVTTKTDRFVEHLFEYFQQRRKKCFKMFACLLNNPYLCIVNPSLNKRRIACIMVSLIFVLALPVALARCVVVAACAFRGLVTGSPRRAGCMAGSARPAQSSARLFVLRGCLCGGGHTHTAMLADVQLTTAAVSLISRMCHVAPRNGPFCAAIWPVSAAKTARFGSQNGPFCNMLSIRWLAGRRAVVAININEMNVRILPNRSTLSPPFPKEGQGWFVE